MIKQNKSLTWVHFPITPGDPLNVFEQIQNGVAITNKDSNIIFVNKAFTRITGYTYEEALNTNPGILHSGRHDKAFYQKMWHSIAENNYWEGEIWNRNKAGCVYPAYLTISTIHFEGDEDPYYIGVSSDISFLKEDEYKKLHLAYYDPLTKLPNRSLFLDRVDQAIQQFKSSHDNAFAILFMDLNKFKPVNDTYGHLMGDHLLEEVGNRLSMIVRDSDTVARVGGDEFLLLINYKDKVEVNELAERISAKIRMPFLIDEKKLEVSTSIGLYFYETPGVSRDDAIKKADAAMYQAKQQSVDVVVSD